VPAGVPIGVWLWLPAEDSGLDPAWPDWTATAGWHPITCTVLGAGWSSGAQANGGVLTLPDAGSLTVVAMDPARELDPTNAAGPLAGRIGIGLPVGIVFGDAPAWTGWLDGITHELRPTDGDQGMTVATLTAYGLATRLVARKLVDVPLPVQASSSRVAYLAELGGVPAGLVRTFGTGVSLRAELYSGDVWSAILDAATAELGAVGVNGAGILHFYTRAAAYAPAADALELGCGPGAYPLASLKLDSRATLVRNHVTATRAAADDSDAPVPQAAEDPASVARYGPLELAVSDLPLIDDRAALSWAEFVVERSSAPEAEVSSLAFAADSAAADALAAAVTGRARLTLRDDHHGPQLTRRLRYLGHTIDASPSSATVKLLAGEAIDLSPGPRTLRIATAAEWRAYGGAHGYWTWTIAEPGIVTWDRIMAPDRRAVSAGLTGHAGYIAIPGTTGESQDDHILIGKRAGFTYAAVLFFPQLLTVPTGARVVEARIRWTTLAPALLAHALDTPPGVDTAAPPADALTIARATPAGGGSGWGPSTGGRGRSDSPAGTGWSTYANASYQWPNLVFGTAYPLTLPALGTVGASVVTGAVCDQLPAGVLRPDGEPCGGAPWAGLAIIPAPAAPQGWGWGCYSDRAYGGLGWSALVRPQLELVYELPSSGPLVVGLDWLELSWESIT
jgi:hypothetical protein